MAKSTFVGHPLHPQLIAGPVALFPFSLVMDLMHLITGKKSYQDAAYYTMLGGYLNGWAAAAAGAVDYFAIPARRTDVQQVANVHAIMNVGVMGMYSVNLLLRNNRSQTGALPLLLSALGTAGLFAAQWYGGQLVYEHGMRVKGVDPIEQERDLKLPQDAQMEEAFYRLEEKIAP